MSHKSLVYFILADDINRVKIGKTKNLRERFGFLQSHNCCKLTLIGLFREKTVASKWHGVCTESELHMKFKALRVHGEWFIAESEIYTYIEERKEDNLIYTRPSTILIPALATP